MRKKILIFGANGLVGNSTKRILAKSDYEVIASNRSDTDLFNLDQVKNKIIDSKPDIIVNAAAKVGGILANNTYRSEFLIENLKINMNILEACIPYPDIKIINLGSSCIYPLNADNPIKESSIMEGKLEHTNSPYAMAKLSAIELGNSLSIQYGHQVINLMPTNLYGPNDNFDENNSHVIPGLISRMHQAKISNSSKFQIWGSGNPLREFLYVDDLAYAIEFIISKDLSTSLINIGSGEEVSIMDLAKIIKNIVGYDGMLDFDKTKPDGNPRKLLDSSQIMKIGWKPIYNLETGIKKTYDWFLENS